MINIRNKNNVVRVAIPYYGTLFRPCLGLERVYFHVQVTNGKISGPILAVWNPRETPEITQWMVKRGIDGIICNDKVPRYEDDFQTSGIWVRWGEEGEPSQLIALLVDDDFEQFAKGNSNEDSRYIVGARS